MLKKKVIAIYIYCTKCINKTFPLQIIKNKIYKIVIIVKILTRLRPILYNSMNSYNSLFSYVYLKQFSSKVQNYNRVLLFYLLQILFRTNWDEIS